MISVDLLSDRCNTEILECLYDDCMLATYDIVAIYYITDMCNNNITDITIFNVHSCF
jgi:hypothetical protein